MPDVREATAEIQASEGVAAKSVGVDKESGETWPTSLLLATDACCQAGHDVAEVERGGGEIPTLACITCTELWGRQQVLRSWQEQCATCFSQAYPNGMPDLGITAQPLSDLP